MIILDNIVAHGSTLVSDVVIPPSTIEMDNIVSIDKSLIADNVI